MRAWPWLACSVSFFAADLCLDRVTIVHTYEDGQLKSSRMFAKRAAVVVHRQRDNMAEDKE